MIAITAPLHALTLTSYSLPLLFLRLTDQSTGVSPFSNTDDRTVPPPIAARAIESAFDIEMYVLQADLVTDACVMPAVKPTLTARIPARIRVSLFILHFPEILN